ncbi:MAG TPA: AAA family ATPase [Phycisphaerae bacterium]|nr:AAA family ATPase [Phycisphaerae bacterium]HRY70678.1 AAA family ATPase [Phycisphaerae bacterium]HSA28727.1 AAA family ATPase [Phycisphaerae bacterium]
MSDQLTCPLCAQSVAMTLIPHLRSEHKIEPEVFRARFPEQALCSAEFASFLKEQNVRRQDGVLHYQLDVAGCPMTARYGVDHPLIPEPDPTFVWTEPARDVAEAVEHNERVFLYGPSGTGKSALVREIAAMVKRPVRRVSLNGETSVADFIGHWAVNGNKETVFVKGILPQAMLEGYILQMDEVDAMQPEVGFILQQILEPHGHLLLTDTGEDITPHADFRLVATANTLGFGSDSGLYASGTHVLNFSWLDRWDVVVNIDYLPAGREVELLHARHPSVKKDLLKCIVKAAGDLRRAQANEELTTVLTTRRLLALCARLERGNEFPQALQVCVLNKVPPEDRKVIGETFEHHVGPLGQKLTP